MRDEAQMWPRASLTTRTGTIETDRIRQLLPIDRVKPAVLGADQHYAYMGQRGHEQKQNIRHVVMSTY
jgi:hypothetical protein